MKDRRDDTAGTRFEQTHSLLLDVPLSNSAPRRHVGRGLQAARGAADLAREQELFATTFSRLDGASHPLARHPAFGDLTHESWGVLLHKHVDHHLRQFGA